MVKRIILILSMWSCVYSLNAQSLIGFTMDPDVDDLIHILELDMSDCKLIDTITTNTFTGRASAIACGPDSNFYFVHFGAGPASKLVRVDRGTGISEDFRRAPISRRRKCMCNDLSA